jgi:hypothetical protein
MSQPSYNWGKKELMNMQNIFLYLDYQPNIFEYLNTENNSRKRYFIFSYMNYFYDYMEKEAIIKILKEIENNVKQREISNYFFLVLRSFDKETAVEILKNYFVKNNQDKYFFLSNIISISYPELSHVMNEQMKKKLKYNKSVIDFVISVLNQSNIKFELLPQREGLTLAHFYLPQKKIFLYLYYPTAENNNISVLYRQSCRKIMNDPQVQFHVLGVLSRYLILEELKQLQIIDKNINLEINNPEKSSSYEEEDDDLLGETQEDQDLGGEEILEDLVDEVPDLEDLEVDIGDQDNEKQDK